MNIGNLIFTDKLLALGFVFIADKININLIESFTNDTFVSVKI